MHVAVATVKATQLTRIQQRKWLVKVLNIQLHHSNYWTKDIKRKGETNRRSHQITHTKRKRIPGTLHHTHLVYHNPMFSCSMSVHVSCLPMNTKPRALAQSFPCCRQVSRSRYPDPSTFTLESESMIWAPFEHHYPSVQRGKSSQDFLLPIMFCVLPSAHLVCLHMKHN